MICPTKQNFALKDGEKAIPQVFFVQGNHIYKKRYYSYVSDAIYYTLSMYRKSLHYKSRYREKSKDLNRKLHFIWLNVKTK